MDQYISTRSTSCTKNIHRVVTFRLKQIQLYIFNSHTAFTLRYLSPTFSSTKKQMNVSTGGNYPWEVFHLTCNYFRQTLFLTFIRKLNQLESQICIQQSRESGGIPNPLFMIYKNNNLKMNIKSSLGCHNK